MLTKIIACMSGWFAGFATVIVLYRLAEWAPAIVSIAVFFAAGCVIGCCAGLSRSLSLHARTFACASFFGVLTGMLPIILNTYGFALVLLPLVALWSGTVAIGMRTGSVCMKRA